MSSHKRRRSIVMKISQRLLAQIDSDLGLSLPFVKGRINHVRNCWHFCTDGSAVDVMFYDENDFVNGMNRIFVTGQSFEVVILAFTLMDTHVHFIIYGTLEECTRFMHEYLRRTSQYLATEHHLSNRLADIPISRQAISDDVYLKTAICYTLKNAPVGGLMYTALDYPWSSGPLYFRRQGLWCSPQWFCDQDSEQSTFQLTVREQRRVLKSRRHANQRARMIGQLVFPGEYVACEVVERLFKTCRAFNYFLCSSREDDVESREGTISHLSIPIQEMRQHRKELCKEMFGTDSLTGLDTARRIKLARTLKSRYNSSTKQIARVCGLVYDEVKDRL